jgi:Family of unknown function (DUF5923)
LQNLKASIESDGETLVFSKVVDQNGLSDLVPQDHKEAARDKLDQGRKVLVEDYFPEDRRDQFIYRIKKVF